MIIIEFMSVILKLFVKTPIAKMFNTNYQSNLLQYLGVKILAPRNRKMSKQ